MKKLIIIIFLISNLTGCNSNEITAKYATYEEALEEDYFAKGWIPFELLNPDMKHIYVRNNLDLNSYLFCFNTDNVPDLFNTSIIQINEVKIHGIRVPNCWNKEVIGKPKVSIKFTHREIVHLIYDKENKKLYGWAEY